jgi:hypothetical protein
MIAVNQDLLGIQCRRFKTNGIADTLIKPLAGDELAVCFFNKGSEERLFEQSIQEWSAKCLLNFRFPIIRTV